MHTCHNFFRQIQDNGLHFPGFASVFRDRPPFPHSDLFFNYRPVVIFRYGKTQSCKIVKKIILLIGERREFFNFCACNISVKLHNFICRPCCVASEILIKINKHIDPRICDFLYFLPLIKPTRKGPKQCPFRNILVITILAADVFIKLF